MKFVMWMLFVGVMGIVGNMDRSDEESVEEFRHEWVTVSDDHGEPRLVSLEDARRVVALNVDVQKENHHESDALRVVPK